MKQGGKKVKRGGWRYTRRATYRGGPGERKTKNNGGGRKGAFTDRVFNSAEQIDRDRKGGRGLRLQLGKHSKKSL